MTGKKARTLRIVIILMLLTVSFVAVYRCSNKIRINMSEETYQNLEDVGKQNAIALSNCIYAYQMALNGIMESITEEDLKEPKALVEKYGQMAESYGLKRVGICMPDGMSYGSDGTENDLKFRTFYNEGMAGNSYITGVIRDQLDMTGEQINVLSMPYFDSNNKNVLAVVGVTFRTKDFLERLELDSFGGSGQTFIVDRDGYIITSGGNDVLTVGSSLYEVTSSVDKRNVDTYMKMQAALREGKSYEGICYLNGVNHFYCEPVYLLDESFQWYIFTVVPESVLADRQEMVLYDLDRMLMFMAIFLIIGIVLIVSIERRHVKDVISLTYVDSLTDGDNYTAFKKNMGKIKDTFGYIVSMDVADFRLINDAVGTSKGDVLIKGMWEIIQDSIKVKDIAAHMGADHFIMFIVGEDREELEFILKTIEQKINDLSKSLGVARLRPYFGIYFGKATDLVEHDYSQASIAKNKIKNRRDVYYAFYDAQDHQRLMEDNMLCNDFNDAIAERRLEVWLQPKFSVAEEKMVGAEALARWRDKEGRLISPGRFIPMLENNGLIATMDEYMFRNTCRLIKGWLAQGYNCVPVSVNLSRASLYFDHVVDKYWGIVVEEGIPVELIQLEITESALGNRDGVRTLLEDFRSRGFHILMDDFGNGYSSISTLSLGCFDTLKVDKSLVDGFNDENGEVLLAYTIRMAKKLGLSVTAEGVEAREQLDFLRSMSCDDIQGYLLSKPLPWTDFETLLKMNK